MIVERAYRPAVRGYVASMDRHQVGLLGMAVDSANFLIDAKRQVCVLRKGSAIVGDSSSTPVGLLEAKWGARARKLVELESASLTNKEPTHGVLYTDDADKEGQFYFRNTNGGGTNHVIGKNFGSTHYPQTASTKQRFKFVPFWVEHATRFTRCVTEAQRRVLCAGSRGTISIDGWRAFPNRYGTPLRWKEEFNDSDSAGTTVERAYPTGPVPPIGQIIATASASAASGSWQGKDRYALSVIFQKADGSYTAYMQPRLPNTTLASGFMIVTVDIANPTLYYPSVTYSQIPRGPEGTVARILVRSNKVDGSASIFPDPDGLQICGVIRDNTTTLYVDTLGSDDGLRENAQVIRSDWMMPPRARHIATFDQRVIVGDLAPNPCAIFLAPYQDSGYLNADDDSATVYGSVYYHMRVTATTLFLKRSTAGPATTCPAANQYTLTAKTMQGIVDEINATVYAGGATPTIAWRAQLAPGINPSAPATDLEPTDGYDFGDNTLIGDGTTGNIRVICGALAVPLYLQSTSEFMTKGVKKRSVQWTVAGPGDTGDVDAPEAMNAWVGGNLTRRDQRAAMGRMMGMGGLLNGCVVAYSNGIALVRNVRGGKTGSDRDYRFEPMVEAKGCVAWSSFAVGDGWVVYMTVDGLVANDGQRVILLSGNLWNREARAGSGKGVWSYEIGQCVKNTATDDDDSCHMHVSVLGGRITVQYRSSGSVTYPDQMVVYDYSENMEAAGLAQLLRKDPETGQDAPFPWSAPLSYRASVVGAVKRSDGIHVYGCYEPADSAFTTGGGRVNELFTGTRDDGNTYLGSVYCGTDDLGLTRQWKRLNLLTCRTQSSANDSVLTASISMDMARASLYGPVYMTPFVTGDLYQSTLIKCPSGLRGGGKVIEVSFDCSTVSDGSYEVHGADAQINVVDSRR